MKNEDTKKRLLLKGLHCLLDKKRAFRELIGNS